MANRKTRKGRRVDPPDEVIRARAVLRAYEWELMARIVVELRKAREDDPDNPCWAFMDRVTAEFFDA